LIAALVLALAAPSREALIGRWLNANPRHTLARLASGPPATATAPPDLRALARSELATPGRYRLTEPVATGAQPWWARVWEWMADRWSRLWSAVFRHVHVGAQQAADIGDALLVVISLVLIFVAVRLLMNLRFLRPVPRLESSPRNPPPSPAVLYRQACTAAQAGDYGGATLLLFAATVTLLALRGTFEAARSATVGDLRRALRARNIAMLPFFDEVATPFVQRAYAERAVGEPQWLCARAAFERLSENSHRSSRPA
jgi:hypothetical protein